MNEIAYIIFESLFLALPATLLLLRAFVPQYMPWWLVVLTMLLVGWLLIHLQVNYYYQHLGDLVRSYGVENTPSDILTKFQNDGAKRVFAALFGWVFAGVYLVPWLLAYALVDLARRKFPK